MKIVNRIEFLKLPSGTMYSLYSPIVFEGLYVKFDSINSTVGEKYIDFLNISLTDSIDSEDFNKYMEEFEKMEKGSSIGMDFDCIGRNGLYDLDQKYAVWEKKDVQGLMDVLKNLHCMK